MPDPTVSPHYLGEQGAQYAKWQLGIAGAMGAINARKFGRFVTPEDTVLDFGCGGGFTLLVLQCARRLGVDPSAAALKVARDNGIEAFASVSAVIPAVDVVISNHALEHTTRPLDELRSIRAILKPTGRLVFSIGAVVALIEAREQPQSN
jgi:SAM-dependent methyltransferase